MAFPTLFPDAKGDPTNESLLRDVSFPERIKHLIIDMVSSLIQKGVYHFTLTPSQISKIVEYG